MTSTVATPTKMTPVKATAQKTNGEKSKSKYVDLIFDVMNRLGKGNSKGVTRAAIANVIKRENEIKVSDKQFNNMLRQNLFKLMGTSDLKVASGTKMSDYHFKLSDSIKRKLKKNEKDSNMASKTRQTKVGSSTKPKKAATGKSPMQKKTPVKKTTKKATPSKKPVPKQTPKKKTEQSKQKSKVTPKKAAVKSK